MEAAHVSKRVPQIVAYSFLLLHVHVDCKLDFEPRQSIIDLSLDLLLSPDFKIIELLGHSLERINDGVLETCLIVPNYLC